MCTWWNFRIYNRRCCATEGTTASVQQHETIRTLQYNSISLFDSPKLLLSSCHNASASASHSLGLRNRTDTPWAGYIFSIVVRVPGFFCGGCRSRPRHRSQGNCSLVLWDIWLFSVHVWIICNPLPRNRHNLHMRSPSVSPVFLMKGRALLRWWSPQFRKPQLIFLCSSSLLFCSFVFLNLLPYFTIRLFTVSLNIAGLNWSLPTKQRHLCATECRQGCVFICGY